METKSLFKPVTRRSSLSEKEKRSKKSNKKRKKSKRCTPGESSQKQENRPHECTEGGCETDTRKETVSLDSHKTTNPEQHHKVSPRSSPNDVSGALSLTESPSINTDLSESTISLISANSQTDIIDQTPTLPISSSNAVLFTESLSACNAKSKPQSSQTGRSQSVAVKSPRRCPASNGIRKATTFNKSKSSNAFLQNTKACAKLKTSKDCEAKVDAEPADKRVEKSEALRWEYCMEDSVKEEERINRYKINRRKRYLAAAQAKGLAWASEYNEYGNPAILQKGITCANEREETTVQQSASNFISVQSLVPVTVHTVKKKIFVDC